jgi:hypothetical protein
LLLEVSRSSSLAVIVLKIPQAKTGSQSKENVHIHEQKYMFHWLTTFFLAAFVGLLHIHTNKDNWQQYVTEIISITLLISLHVSPGLKSNPVITGAKNGMRRKTLLQGVFSD